MWYIREWGLTKGIWVTEGLPNNHRWSVLQNITSVISCQASITFSVNAIIIRIVYMLLNDHTPCTISVGETMIGANRTKSKYEGCRLDDEEEWPHFKNGITFYSLRLWFHLSKRHSTIENLMLCLFCLYPKAVRATIRETPTSTTR
jgi:hypothetical protein